MRLCRIDPIQQGPGHNAQALLSQPNVNDGSDNLPPGGQPMNMSEPSLNDNTRTCTSSSINRANGVDSSGAVRSC